MCELGILGLSGIVRTIRSNSVLYLPYAWPLLLSVDSGSETIDSVDIGSRRLGGDHWSLLRCLRWLCWQFDDCIRRESMPLTQAPTSTVYLRGEKENNFLKQRNNSIAWIHPKIQRLKRNISSLSLINIFLHSEYAQGRSSTRCWRPCRWTSSLWRPHSMDGISLSTPRTGNTN